jgi:hypothetical protein
MTRVPDLPDLPDLVAPLALVAPESLVGVPRAVNEFQRPRLRGVHTPLDDVGGW